ncbi:MAG: hypothetical protein JW798_18795 [Prolixibacteraceae bacterium]|nr:hypothetical protein [Prolixibacteraceae bacterium]
MKAKFLYIITIILFVFIQNANALDADIIVALDGSGDFIKIQDAINSVPSNQSTRRTVIFIKNGVYNTEKLIVPYDKKNVTLIGESRDQTIISYHIYDCSNAESGNKCPAEDAALWTGDNIRTSATLTIAGDGFRAENLTIRNTAGPVGQALAITVTGDKIAFVNCNLLGYQDTVYLWTAGQRTYFENCMILGRTDFIYGGGIGFFESCEIRSYGGGYITAPSTAQDQPYGFVFNNCELTYSTGSPRNGDDGNLVRFGRPWHNYPKVAWLNCWMTEMIHPQGWGDTWNMSYAATSPDLHLYEYNNTGPGADMSGRAAWVGLREITDEEAENYTAAKVLNATDGWAPYEEAPLANTYVWDGGGANKGWYTQENWDPDGIPAIAEIAIVSGNQVIEADGGLFNADLLLKDGATLKVVANSVARYISGEHAIIKSDGDYSLSGIVASKDTITLVISSVFTLNTSFSGINSILKDSSGTAVLNVSNESFYGNFIVAGGTLYAKKANSLGKANVEVKPGATLWVENDDAFFPENSLSVETGAKVQLDANITISEFYIDGVMQNAGDYNSGTHPDLLQGSGTIIIGRPSSFLFSGGVWDEATNYSPALLPEAGETVYCEGEMETASTTNLANVTFVEGKGRLRLRGTHISTGTLTFEGNQRISYATSGEGFSLEAPIVVLGDISLEMSSGNANGSIMTLLGSISGSTKITVKNTQSSTANTSKVWLLGNNEAFNGVWDVSTPATNPAGNAGLVGAAGNSLGSAVIIVGSGNYLQFNHPECTNGNNLILQEGAIIIANESVRLKTIKIDGTVYDSGIYNATSHPEIIQGSGDIYVGNTGIEQNVKTEFGASYYSGYLILKGNPEKITIYNIYGSLMHSEKVNNTIMGISLKPGIYLIVNEKQIGRKLVVNP